MTQQQEDALVKAKRLARAVRYRRVQLGYHPRAKWPETARLSEGLIRKIESGRYPISRYREDTLIRLELDLGWAAGSIDDVLAGGQPTPIDRSA